MWWLLRSCHWRADTTCLHNLIYPIQSDLSIQFCYDPTNPDVSYYFIFDLLPHKEFYDLLAPSGALLFIMGYNIWHCVSMSAWFCPTAVAKFLRLYITQFSIFFKFGAILPKYIHNSLSLSFSFQRTEPDNTFAWITLTMHACTNFFKISLRPNMCYIF